MYGEQTSQTLQVAPQGKAAEVLSKDAEVEDLNFRLRQHLKDLDDRMAVFAERASVSEGVAPPLPPPPTRRPPILAERGQEPLLSISGVAREPPENRRAAEGTASAGFVESLLRGIESKELSVSDALGSLEQASGEARRLQGGKKAGGGFGHGAGQLLVRAAPLLEVSSRGSQAGCQLCSVLALQVRALAQSLSGLGAQIYKWSAGLAYRRRVELAQLVLDYALPCEHLDSRLETLCAELQHGLNPTEEEYDAVTKSRLAAADLYAWRQAMDEASRARTWEEQLFQQRGSPGQGDNDVSGVMRTPQFLAMNLSTAKLGTLHPDIAEKRGQLRPDSSDRKLIEGEKSSWVQGDQSSVRPASTSDSRQRTASSASPGLEIVEEGAVRESWVYELEVVVASARGLPDGDETHGGAGASDPFCICEVRDKGIAFQTRMVSNTSNPVWNHSAKIADFRGEDALVFTVLHRDRKKTDVLGRVSLPAENIVDGTGFEGELQLMAAGRERGQATDAFLFVKVSVASRHRVH
eukprot:TRINITY_DN35624_c0_g1_i1.p1 TRINITY_DN35624_c0_g1~~TRINITY_DN35624_c0_g1_i1.p1  ORF type:complete len:538 (-),score=110.29 TRINITY_DN35624_c0_g1_i1:39-1607(-)